MPSFLAKQKFAACPSSRARIKTKTVNVPGCDMTVNDECWVIWGLK